MKSPKSQLTKALEGKKASRVQYLLAYMLLSINGIESALRFVAGVKEGVLVNKKEVES